MAGTEQRRLMDAWAPRLHWMTVGLLALLCGVVAVLQYRWIGEISETERDRLEVALRERLAIVQRDFNDELRNAANALIPTEEEIEAEGRDAAYEARMGPARPVLFSRIALAIPEKGDLAVQVFDDRSGKFEAAPWPSLWSRTRDYLRAKLGGPQAAGGEPDPMILEYPRFDAGREQEWLIIELNAKYVREKLLPEIVHRELADYDVQVLARGPDAREAIYSSSEGLQLSDRSDASVTLLESGPGPTRRRGPGGSRGKGPTRPPPPQSGGEVGPGPGGGRWLLLARHHSGSLEALVEQTRRRNLLLSGGLLLLILGTAAALVRYSRQSEQLAETRMSFVASVSHELRTPLTVIRTAAFNLRGRLAHSPDHVERYGKLIQTEAERLSSLVEQVLQFANARTDSILRKVEPLAVRDLIQRSLESAHVRANPAMVVETHLSQDLPALMGDDVALTHALENLIENAVKHGAVAEPWIRVSAARVSERNREFVEIAVADRGPGIPPEELATIFEPFQRGRRAIEDQVRGAGLGLDLVKKIVEAHGGSIRVHSEPLKRTEFIVRVPAAPRSSSAPGEPETENEFAHPAD